MQDSHVGAPFSSGFGGLFRSFQSRNYRLFFGGQGVSLIGTWMQQTATGWLVYRLTDSEFLLGLVGFAVQAPSFFISPIAGVLADRWDRRRVLIITQMLSMIQAFAMGILVISAHVTIGPIICLSLLLGTINAFDIPTRQSFIMQMVEDKSLLSNALALNSSMFNMARMVGPSVAGIVIASFGEGVCFLLNAVSYITVIFSYFCMTLPKSPDAAPVAKKPSIFKELKEGLAYVSNNAPIKWTLLLLALFSLAGTPVMILLPVFARDILHGGANTLGFLMGASGVGAFCGAIFLASRKNVRSLVYFMGFGASGYGCVLIAFAWSKDFRLSMLLMFLSGVLMMMQMVSGNTIIQTLVDDDKRGRVMSLFAAAFIGLAPFGGIIMGTVSEHTGAPSAITAGGVVCLAGAILFLRKLSLFKKAVADGTP